MASPALRRSSATASASTLSPALPAIPDDPFDPLEDEQVLSGVRRKGIEARRTLDNVAVRPLFRDRELAKDMLSLDLALVKRPMAVDPLTRCYDGVVSERGVFDGEPLTPVGKALEEGINRLRERVEDQASMEASEEPGRRGERLAAAVKRGDLATFNAILDTGAQQQQQPAAGALPDPGPWNAGNGVASSRPFHRRPCKADARAIGARLRRAGAVAAGAAAVPTSGGTGGANARGREPSQPTPAISGSVLGESGADRARERGEAPRFAEEGWDAMMWASHLDGTSYANALLECGEGDVSRVDKKSGWTALMWAAHNNNHAILEQLLRAGAPVDHANRFGATALTWAAQQGRLKSCEILLRHGADVRHRTLDGNSMLSLASRAGHVELASLALDRGAALDEVNLDGDTPLMGAARFGHLKAAKMLLARGCDVLVRNMFAQDAVELAGNGGHTELSRLLLDCRSAVERRMAEQGRLRLLSSQGRRRRANTPQSEATATSGSACAGAGSGVSAGAGAGAATGKK
jgi:hypothetical protein